MLSVDNWPTDTDSTEVQAQVVHLGAVREVSAVSLRRELPSTFAAQVAQVGGMTQASGVVDWKEGTDLTEFHPTPYHRGAFWVPKTGDRVEISLGYKDALARVLTGKVKDVSGSPYEHPSSAVVDFLGRFDRSHSVPPLSALMPPINPGDPWRVMGLYPTFFTDRFTRAAGYCSTPLMASGCVMSAPLMGSAWPERGTLARCLHYQNQSSGSPQWRETPWGMGCANLVAEYTPTGNTVLDRPMEITAMTPNPRGGVVAVGAVWGATQVRLYVDQWNVQGYVINSDGSSTVVASIPGAGNVFTLRVEPSGGNLVLTVGDSTGARNSGTIARPAGVTGAMSRVDVHSVDNSSTVGGVQVSFPTAAWISVGYRRTAYITPAAFNANLLATPAIINRNLQQLLVEQSEAELSAMWIDQDDVFHWVNRHRLISKSPVGTLTSLDNLRDLPWTEDASGVASVVEVSYRTPERFLFKHPEVTVWEASYGEIEHNGTETWTELIHPDTDSDWLGVDTTFNTNESERYSKRGSALYRHFFSETGTRNQAGYGSTEGIDAHALGGAISRVDDRTYRVTTNVYAIGPGGYERNKYTLNIPTTYSMDWGGVEDRPFPIGVAGTNFPKVRAMGRIDWADMMATAPGWDVNAPALQHDVKHWVQDAAAAEDLAEFISARVSAPTVVLRSVPIIPDSRIELGDVFLLQDPIVTGLELKVLVVGIDQQMGGEPLEWSMNLDLRVLTFTITSATLSDLDKLWAGRLLTALDTARAGDSLAAFDRTPLKGTP